MKPKVEDFTGVDGWRGNAATRKILDGVSESAVFTDIDWEDAWRRHGSPQLPDYVIAPIHGVPGGFGNPGHAASFDAIVAGIFAEYAGDERSVRSAMPALVATRPTRILDVGCGTGTSTRAWRERFPDAEIDAVDLSPYMLAVAERRLAGDRLARLHQGNGELLDFDDATFDLVTATFLLHELPDEVATRVLAEMRRVVRRGGELAVLEPYARDGRILHPIPFPEPYLKNYLARDWDAAFADAGFDAVTAFETDSGWIRMAVAA